MDVVAEPINLRGQIGQIGFHGYVMFVRLQPRVKPLVIRCVRLEHDHACEKLHGQNEPRGGVAVEVERVLVLGIEVHQVVAA